ncbi:hypothetical protein NQZ68_011387 [Dissostichus eleginoides]|nr:hypothetical protein NQZ68_011387 [Dissostichus eleginoides]
MAAGATSGSDSAPSTGGGWGSCSVRELPGYATLKKSGPSSVVRSLLSAGVCVAAAVGSVRRNTVFSPGSSSDGFSARSQLGGSPEQGRFLRTNRRVERKERVCAGQRFTPEDKTSETSSFPLISAPVHVACAAQEIHGEPRHPDPPYVIFMEVISGEQRVEEMRESLINKRFSARETSPPPPPTSNVTEDFLPLWTIANALMETATQLCKNPITARDLKSNVEAALQV